MTEKPTTIAVLAHADHGPVVHWAATGSLTMIHSAPYPAGTHVLDWMEHARVDQLWWWGRGWDGWDDLDDETTSPGWTAGPHSDTWRVFYRQGVYGARELSSTDEDGRSPWRTAESPLTLLRALILYARHVGPWRWGPGSTGTRLMRETYPHAAPCTNLPDIAHRGMIEGRLSWCRQVAPDELAAARYVHAYDRTGMYLAAAGVVSLGLGDCVRCDGWELVGHEPRPGYYRVTQPGGWAPELSYLGNGDVPTWITRPTLDLLHGLGGKPLIHEAYVWPSFARALAPWYERLRDARTAFLARDDAPARLALAALKVTYTQAIGWLGHDFSRDEPPHGEQVGDALAETTHRAVYGGAPDWRHAVHAMANANLYRAVRKLEAAGVPVLGVADVDTVYVLSDEEAGHPGVGPIGTGLGEWKHKGCADLWHSVVQATMFTSPIDADRAGALARVGAVMREEKRRGDAG